MPAETKFRNIPLSAQKLRAVSKSLGGLKLEWALRFLALHCTKRLRPIRRAIGCVASSIRKVGTALTAVRIANIRIDEAASHRTLRARAKGRTDSLRHPKSHITITTEVQHNGKES